MAFKHALVVDDSKSARIALKRLLEKHHLIVDFAESGEGALEFLHDQPVDVIFMDHTMPGMDGLEAVSEIKSDPRTAMIPVMMYTAKEGEVYVGQARALGAIGVLPKQVQPAELFDVLLKLGLVEERRSSGRRRRRAQRRAAMAAEVTAAPADNAAAGSPTAADATSAARPVSLEETGEFQGIALEGLVTRILQDQRQELRADILNSQRDFARAVAKEVLEQHEQTHWLDHYETKGPKSFGIGAMAALGLAMLLPILILLVLFWQARSDRDAALADNAVLTTAAQQVRLDAASRSTELMADFDVERQRASTRYERFVEALEWGVNEGAGRPYDGLAFDDAQLNRLRELLARLEGIGFQGIVRLESHLGEFCMVADDDGAYGVAEPPLPLAQCGRFGHPLDGSVSTSQRQSLGFANFLATSPLANDAGIEIEIVARGRGDTARRFPYPSNITTAGEWNVVAEMNNRVEYSLLPLAP